ncbi:DUF2075 domain-containing protein [Streptomyces sp. NPDC058401]|uniref:DUF2075 domain-containing protein n=1 Tax=Streptomyces sp. NPDC058401 TaxID=3346480 RepID=UPI0036554929
MLLLQLSARQLLRLHARGRLLPHMAARWIEFQRKEASPGEQAAWKESLVRLAEELVEAGHGEVHMFVECRPDGVAAPADVILVGTHPESRQDSLLVVELKRWKSVAQATDPQKVDVPGYRTPKKHPSTQVRGIIDYFTADQAAPGLAVSYAGLTYLHNATEDSVGPLLKAGTDRGAHALYFTDDTREELLEELGDRFTQESGAPAAARLLRRLGLSNAPLLEAVAYSEGADTAFTLRGEQRTVWRDVKRSVERVGKESEGAAGQAVFLVRGGAGTGKSAIGLQLLRYFTAKGLRAGYATGSYAFDGSLRDLFQKDGVLSEDQLAYFLNFVEAPDPLLDLLICDEAHRLRAKSEHQRMKAEDRGKQPQVDELIQAARVTVFLLDENQSLRRDDVGNSALIEEAAQRHGVALGTYDLRTEFRCGGSDSYRNWVLDLLGISGEVAQPWAPDGLMYVEMADSVEALEEIVLREERDGATARMVAGFAWPWSEPHPQTHVLHKDVQIGDWHRTWNAKGTRSRYGGGEPPAKYWGVRPQGIGQIGCVYTAQGLEWDWCGVIMGDDMVWRDGEWIFRKGKASPKDEKTGIRETVRKGSMDPMLPGDPAEFARRIRNAYHVLLTRASRCTVIYSTDEDTRRHLRTLIDPVDDQGLRPAPVELSPQERLRREIREYDARSGRRRKSSVHEGQVGFF